MDWGVPNGAGVLGRVLGGSGSGGVGIGRRLLPGWEIEFWCRAGLVVGLLCYVGRRRMGQLGAGEGRWWWIGTGRMQGTFGCGRGLVRVLVRALVLAGRIVAVRWISGRIVHPKEVVGWPGGGVGVGIVGGDRCVN